MLIKKSNFGYKLISGEKMPSQSSKTSAEKSVAILPGESVLELIKRLTNLFKSILPEYECEIRLHYQDEIVKYITPDTRDKQEDLENENSIPLRFGRNTVAFMKVSADEKIAEEDELKINMLADLYGFLIYHHLAAHSMNIELQLLKNRQPDSNQSSWPDPKLIHEDKIRALQQLAGGLAHELNNLLGGILGVAEFAMTSPETDNIKFALKNIMTAGERASMIVNNLFRFSGNLLPEKRLYKLHRVIDSAIDSLADGIDESEIIIKKSYLAGPELFLDFSMIRHALQCLFQNAIDNLESNGHLKVTLESDDVFAAIHIEDTGPAIPESDLPLIVEPFYSTKGILAGGKGRHQGLGVSVAYGIIKAHGGDLEVDRTVDGNPVFSIKLPLNTGF